MAKSIKKLTPTPLDAEFQKHRSEDMSASRPPSSKKDSVLSERPQTRDRIATTKTRVREQSAKEQVFNSSLYLQLHIENVAKYLSRGLFYPILWEHEEGYRENRAARIDVLSYFPHALFLAPGIVGSLKENEVLIELLLVDSEKDQLNPIGEAFLLSSALPVSRVRKIFFASKNAQAKYLASRAIFEDSFFPEKLIEQDAEQLSLIARLPSLPTSLLAKRTNEEIPIPHKHLDYFDRFLGMFGYMKNIPLLRANSSNTISDFSSGFLTALSLINNDVKTQDYIGHGIFKLIFDLENNQTNTISSSRQILFSIIIKRIFSGQGFSYRWAQEKTKELNELSQYSNLFQDLSQEGLINYNFAIKLLRENTDKGKPDQNLPLIALIFFSRFGHKERAHTDKQSVRIHFNKDNEASEYEITVITALLGLYYGYQNMMRDDKNLDIKDPVFNALSKNMNRVKFRIDQFIDRFIIECVYRFSFNDLKPINDSLNFLKEAFDDTPRFPALPIGYVDHQALVQGTPLMKVSISEWAPFVKALPDNVPLSHPIFHLLTLLGKTISKEYVTILLESIPLDQRAKAIDFLRANKLFVS